MEVRQRGGWAGSMYADAPVPWVAQWALGPILGLRLGSKFLGGGVGWGCGFMGHPLLPYPLGGCAADLQPPTPLPTNRAAQM